MSYCLTNCESFQIYFDSHYVKIRNCLHVSDLKNGMPALLRIYECLKHLVSGTSFRLGNIDNFIWSKFLRIFRNRYLSLVRNPFGILENSLHRNILNFHSLLVRGYYKFYSNWIVRNDLNNEYLAVVARRWPALHINTIFINKLRDQ